MVREVSGGVEIRVKVVPGASREGVAGVLGDRVKVRVSAPAEDGRANAAVCRVLAGALGVKGASVRIVSGHGSREKSVVVEGPSATAVRERLGLA
ncbi:MAG: DUF167 domain-containing protein [Phycisphaeraceae bacterium]|nr:MAG: DUF167 domain-containing protein [Phycisphaeraceae bacterium]